MTKPQDFRPKKNKPTEYQWRYDTEKDRDYFLEITGDKVTGFIIAESLADVCDFHSSIPPFEEWNWTFHDVIHSSDPDTYGLLVATRTGIFSNDIAHDKELWRARFAVLTAT